MKIPQYIPFGRLNELRSLPEADRIAYLPGKSFSSDYRIKVYASRKALEAMLRNPGQWHALVKTPTESNMLVHPAFQKAI